MRKRFISGLTAVCMLGILLANSFLAVPASAVIAEVGASVAAGLLMGTLFNQMTGGTGYDFTDAFADCFSFVVTPHNQFIRDNPDADIYLPDGTPYYVDGQYAAAIELKKGEAEITKMVQSHWNIAESLGLKSPQEVIHSALEVLNKGLADGSIVIHVDDDGNISMPTTSWCNTVNDIYDQFGVYTNKNGLNRVQTLYSVVSPYIYTNYNGWLISSDAPGKYELENYDAISTGRYVYFVPYFVADNQLHILRFTVRSSTNAVGFSSKQYQSVNSVTAPLSYEKENWNTYFDSMADFLQTFATSITLNNTCDSISYSTSGAISWASSPTGVYTITEDYQSAYSGKSISDFSDIQGRGFCVVGEKDYANFCVAAKQGSFEQRKDTLSIPLTGIENTIGNMGLAGVGSGATKGTVSVNSKTKDITVTNEATKEAELVIEQGNAGDIDTPDVDSITDKFPFSLPFDIYNLVTIFVRDEQKPIFEIPIQTTLDIAGEDYKVDEKIVLDLTQFQLNGVDIIRVFTRTVTYVAFIAFLIKITPHVIKH